MAINGIGKTEVSAVTPEMWSLLALATLKRKGVIYNLVNRNYDSVVAKMGDTVNVPVKGTLTVNDKVENVSVTLQNPTARKKQIELTEHKEVSWLLEDIASAEAIDSAMELVEEGSSAIVEQIDTDLMDLYASVDHAVYDIPASPTDDDVFSITNHILPAGRLLNKQKAPREGRTMIIDSFAQEQLLQQAQFTSVDYGIENAEALRKAFIGSKYGFDFFLEDVVITNEAAAHGYIYHGMAFTKDGLILVTRPLPKPEAPGVAVTVKAHDGVVVRHLQSYNPSYLGIQHTLDVLYGVDLFRHGEVDDDIDLGYCVYTVPYYTGDLT